LVFIGLISYSLYLWHVAVGLVLQRFAPLQGAALVAAEIVLAFGMACASYFLIELRFLRRRKAHQRLGSTKVDVEAAERGHPDRAAANPRRAPRPSLQDQSEPPPSP
jgi:peptidoglycan/LPS O-acetylase OafA/YrhL